MDPDHGTEGERAEEQLHAPDRRLDLAFAALAAVPAGAFVHVLGLPPGSSERPPLLRARVPVARWTPTELHPLTYVDPADHVQVHETWMEAALGPDRVATTTVRITEAIEADDELPPGPPGRYELTILDFVGTPGMDSVVAVLHPAQVDADGDAPAASPHRDPTTFRLRLDRRGIVLDATATVHEVLGHDPTDLVGRPIADLLHPDDASAAAEVWTELLAVPDRTQSLRLRVRHRDGDWRWLANTVWNGLADPSRGWITSELHDIHAQVLAEQEQAASELSFRTLAESLPVGVAVLDEDGRVHFANHRILAILADVGVINPDQAHPVEAGRTVPWQDVVDPAFASQVTDLVRPGDPGAGPRAAQIRVAGPDGTSRHLLVHVLTSHREGARNVIVSVQDVSSEVLTGLAHARLIHVVDDIDDAVIVGELGGPISYVNNAAHRFVGADAVGRPLRDFMDPALTAQVTEEVYPSLRAALPWRGDLEVPDLDGRLHTLATTVSPVLDAGAEVAHFGVTLRDVTAERAHARELAHQARHDPLSGLPNRLALMEYLEEVAERGDADSVAVCFIDLDNLKIVNDGLGHGAGDRLLEVVAHQLRSVPGPDIVARFGGDEFVVVAQGLDAAGALDLAHRILDAVERAQLPGITSHMSASIGVATARRNQLDPESLVRDADAAMYAAKRAGRGRCALFDESVRERVTRRFVLETNLRQALFEDAVGVHLQPLVNLDSGETTGLEALARWNSVPPAEFIPVAEESGLIVPLGHAVLRRALAEAAELRASRPELAGLRIGVNVSGRELDEPDFADRFLAAIEESSVPAAHVVLELTESVLIDPGDHVDQAIVRVRDAGVDLALDDFGSGYSSLSYLRRYPIDLLKLDITYTKVLTTDPETRVIVEAIVSMANRLGIGVVAEGIETPEQLHLVRELGVRWAQGYLLGRPAPLGDLLRSGLPPLREVSSPSQTR